MEIKNLHVEAEGKRILRGINLKIGKGQRHVLMGTNASGKTTLASTIMGLPPYRIISGQITFGGKLLNNLKINERAKLGIALTFQSPLKVDVNFAQFISEIETKFGSSLAKELSSWKTEFEEEIKRFKDRNLNDGLSGGEKSAQS